MLDINLWSKKKDKELKIPTHETLGAKHLSLCAKRFSNHQGQKSDVPVALKRFQSTALYTLM